jgi:hypothetical protein
MRFLAPTGSMASIRTTTWAIRAPDATRDRRWRLVGFVINQFSSGTPYVLGFVVRAATVLSTPPWWATDKTPLGWARSSDAEFTSHANGPDFPPPWSGDIPEGAGFPPTVDR